MHLSPNYRTRLGRSSLKMVLIFVKTLTKGLILAHIRRIHTFARKSDIYLYMFVCMHVCIILLISICFINSCYKIIARTRSLVTIIRMGTSLHDFNSHFHCATAEQNPSRRLTHRAHTGPDQIETNFRLIETMGN